MGFPLFSMNLSVEQIEACTQLMRWSLLYDEDYYVTQLGYYPDGVEPARHYLLWGWRQGYNPSAFFDTKYYLKKNPHLLEQSLCPLIDFIRGWKEHRRKPCVLFDTEYYCRKVTDEKIGHDDPVTHYLSKSAHYESPHPLFDAEYYLQINSDVRNSGLNPWWHFVRFGKYENRPPHPLFDDVFYERQADGVVNEYSCWFEHFIEEGAAAGLSPCDAFNAKKYLQIYPHASRNPLEHFQLICKQAGSYYAQALAAIFHTGGEQLASSEEEQIPIASFGLYSQSLSLEEKLNVWHGSKKPIMIFFGHEGSRTGAPLILLELVRHFSNAGYECIVIIADDGPITRDYQQYAVVHVLDGVIPLIAQTRRCIDALIPFIEEGRVAGALVNTGTLAGLYDDLKGLGVHTITLIHEFMDGFSKEHIAKIYCSSDELVFPSRFIMDLCNKCLPLGEFRTHVRAQGLVKENFGRLNVEQSRKTLRQQLGIEDESFIVLGVGSLDLRKGFDFFLSAARKFSNRFDPTRPVYFVWLGAGKLLTYSLHYYAKWDIQQSQLNDTVRVLQNTADNEIFFAGSDVFFMCSRQDPFPCVVQESLAYGLPVVSFTGSGGAAEMLQNGGGTLCQYGNVDSVAEAIEQYLNDEELRLSHGAVGRAIGAAMDFTSYFEYIKNLFPVVDSDESENALALTINAQPTSLAGSVIGA